jgi:hypothetical protein
MRVYKFLSAHFGLKSLYERRLKISRLEDLNDPFELIPYDLSDERRRRAMHEARDALVAHQGVICFSTHWRDPVIWAHYADKHRGICLGFEIPERVCKCVVYVKDRLPFPASLTLQDAEAMLFTKFTNWEYEQEVRTWTDLDEVEDGLYYKDFDANLRLAEVIVGARGSVPESGITRALGPLKHNVTLAKARAGFKKFEIVVDQRGLT